MDNSISPFSDLDDLAHIFHAHDLPSLEDVDDAIQPVRDSRQQKVIHAIEEILEQHTEVLLRGEGPLEVELRNRKPPRSRSLNTATRSQAEQEHGNSSRVLKFPGRTVAEAWQFTVVMRVINVIHEALLSDEIVTKRDIFYREPALFVTQSVVNRVVDDLSHTFAVPRAALNVTATAKGLVAGALRVTRDEEVILDCSLANEDHLISVLMDSDHLDIEKVAWILVVEKEATFRSIITTPFWDEWRSCGVLTTAKGYPDVATRALLRRLASQACFPIYALMDYDPDGLNILRVYMHGSLSVDEENRSLAVPSIMPLGISTEQVFMPDFQTSQGLLKLSSRDRLKAIAMIERAAESDATDGAARTRDLQVMLHLGYKAEIQILSDLEGGLGAWLQTKLNE